VADIDDKQGKSVGLVSQIPFGAIIGGPLNAAVEAQGAAAMACYEFIRNVGFELESVQKDSNGNAIKDAAGNPVTLPGKVREITFRVERTVAQPAAGAATGTQDVTTTGQKPVVPSSRLEITVPLLTIMPLPFIRIESLTVAYKVHIVAEDTHADSATKSVTTAGSAGVTAGWGLWKVNLNASISSKKDSTATNTSKYSVEQTMDVNVHAVQDDMPAGMARILSILTDAITVTRG
jgi:hypothetical protein